MKCADPVLCYTFGSRRQFRHYSLANPSFRLIANRKFDCGKCIFCRKKKSRELAVRCVLHASLYSQNCFLTLTYDEQKTGYHNTFQYSDIQDFKKRLRRHCEYHHDKKVQVFNVHEYGKNGKKHWHLVLFNHDFDDKEIHTIRNGNPLYKSKKLEKLWKHGFASIGNVTEASAMYQSQYMQKDFQYGHAGTSRGSHSKHSGIGRDYFLANYRQILRLGFIPFAGKKIPIPRYFIKLAHKHYSHFHEPRNFFDTDERSKLYTPFKPGAENREISDLYIHWKSQQLDSIRASEEAWALRVQELLYSGDIPEFALSADNYLYDLNNKKQHEL